MNEPPNPEVPIFAAALELPADQRGAYLDQACAGNAFVRRQVEALLQVHDEAGDFFDKLARSAAAESTNPAGQPGDRIGCYKLLQQIGEGGCGVVYLAEQEEPVRRRVALKVIKLGMDTKSVIARFEAERQALALMDHPNIAKVLEAGATKTGRPYFVMELVRGIKITDYCDDNNLGTTARLELFIQVCQAIQHAHQKGIIHRDIKPSNILVENQDGKPVPKIIDFGIAKATTGQRLTDKTLFTAFEQFIGTPAYMSPEQARLSGLDIDTRSDIYSLGVLLYELPQQTAAQHSPGVKHAPVVGNYFFLVGDQPVHRRGSLHESGQSRLDAHRSVTLQDNGGDNLTLSNNGTFTFPTALPNGQSYTVTVSGTSGGTSIQTEIYWPVTANGSGTISGTNVTNVAVQCTSFYTGNLDVDMYNAAVADGTANGGVPGVMYTENGGPFRVTAEYYDEASIGVAEIYTGRCVFTYTVGSNSCSSTSFPSGTPVIQFGTLVECGFGPYKY